MRKTLKKTLSLILALILIVSTMSFAFAVTYSETITEDEAKEIAMKYIAHTPGATSVVSETYQSVDAYKVVSDVIINNKLIKFTCHIDKETGDVLYRTGKYYLDAVSILNPLEADEVSDYAISALGAIKEDVVVLTNEVVTNDKGNACYHIIFCEGVFERNECTIEKYTGFIDNIKVGRPTNIFDRLVLMIRVFIAKFDPFGFINL